MVISSFEEVLDRCHRQILRLPVCAIIIGLIVFFRIDNCLTADPDLFARVATGKLIFDTGMVATEDPFAFTPTKPVWIDHEWLSGAIFYLCVNIGGDICLSVFKLLIIFTTILLLVSAQRIYSERQSTFTLLLGAFLLADSSYIWASTVRCQVFTFLFLSVFLHAMSRVERGANDRVMLICPLILPFWVNCHGGFVVGLGLLFIYLTCAFLRNTIALSRCLTYAVLSLFSLGLTPYPLGDFLGYLQNALAMSRPHIPEWDAVWPNDVKNLSSYLVLFLSLSVLFIYRRKIPIFVFPFVLVSAAFGFMHERLMAIFYFVNFVFVIGYLQRLLLDCVPRDAIDFNKWARISIISVFLILIFIAADIGKNYRLTLSYSDYPQRPIEWLRMQNRSGKLLVNFNHGSFALWRLYPKFLVSLDGRYEEVYSNDTVELVSAGLDCNNANQEQAFLKLSATDVLTSSSEECFSKYFDLAYDDGVYRIFSKNHKGETARIAPPIVDMWHIN